jgi:ArsR family transcriptional regulator
MKLLPPDQLTPWLRAAGDPSRLRLLALCGEGAFSVSELAGALKQSEPRTSRHLKILADVGLIERARQGQRVQYRLGTEPAAASFVRGLLGLLDRADAVLAQDRASARALSAAPAGGTESRLGRALAALLDLDVPRAPAGPMLLLGVGHPELLASAARHFSACTALAPSRRAAQWARAFAARGELACRILQAASADGFGADDFARAGGPFAGVVFDQPGVPAAALPAILGHARRVLVPGGRLWLLERYDALDTAGNRIVEHPLARLRRLLGDAGLACEKIIPVEADGEHVLAARALAVEATQRSGQGAA